MSRGPGLWLGVAAMSAAAWGMFCLPYVAILLLSADEDMYRIEKWYPATLLVVLFAAVIVGWKRIPKKWEGWAIAWLLLSTIVGYALYSHAPLGGRYDPALYHVSDRDRLGLAFLQHVPKEARVASQVKYVPHLTLREYIYLYPWIQIGRENIDYFVLDRKSNPYPQDQGEVNAQITNMVADPSYVVVQEADGLYLLQNGGKQLPAFPVAKAIPPPRATSTELRSAPKRRSAS